MNIQATSINALLCFDGVSIWRALEKSCTFVSRYFWCTIWRTPLTAFPAACQTWRRIIISFCILCFYQLQTILHFDNTVRERQKDRKGIGRWDSIWQRTKVICVHQATIVCKSCKDRVEGFWTVKTLEGRKCFYCMIFSVSKSKYFKCSKCRTIKMTRSATPSV